MDGLPLRASWQQILDYRLFFVMDDYAMEVAIAVQFFSVLAVSARMSADVALNL